MMQLREGGYYLAADGSKRGPMRRRLSGQLYEDGRSGAIDPEWNAHGVNMQFDGDGFELNRAPDLIAEWVDAAPPEVGTLEAIGAKVGDVVQFRGDGKHTVHDGHRLRSHQTKSFCGYDALWDTAGGWRIYQRYDPDLPDGDQDAAELAADLRAKLSEAAAIATQLDAAGWTVEVIGDCKTATTGADTLTLTANITRMKEERL